MSGIPNWLGSESCADPHCSLENHNCATIAHHVSPLRRIQSHLTICGSASLAKSLREIGICLRDFDQIQVGRCSAG